MACSALVTTLALTTSLRAQPSSPARAEPVPPADEARGWQTKPGASDEDVGFFVPRMLLLPARLVAQTVFWPLRKGLRWVTKGSGGGADEGAKPEGPTLAAAFDVTHLSGFGPSVGLELAGKKLGRDGETLAARANFFGPYRQAYQLSFDAERAGESHLFVRSYARFEDRPKMIFRGVGDPSDGGPQGVGPRETSHDARYRETHFRSVQHAGYGSGVPGALLVQLGGRAAFDARTFGRPRGGGDLPLEQAYDPARVEGYERGALTAEFDATLSLDTRDEGAWPSSGVLVEAFAGGAPRLERYAFVHHGFEIVGLLDLFHRSRVLALRAAFDAVEGGDRDVPFTSLPRLGGPERLRGFALDAFRDKKAVFGSAEYRYPVHELVTGLLFVDAGRVASDYGRLVHAPRPLHFGLGGGLRVRSGESELFALDLAYGEGFFVFFTASPAAHRGRERWL